MTYTDRKTEAAAGADLAYTAQTPALLPLEGPSTVLIPDGAQLHIIDPEEYRDRPSRSKAGTTMVRDAASFVGLISDDTGDEVAPNAGLGVRLTTRVYADPADRSIVAVLNDDANGYTAGWRDRRIKIGLRHTPEWTRWTQHDAGPNNRLMTQMDFALFIEESLTDITDPDGATMLEIAQNLEATQTATFKQRTRLSSGARTFSWSEEVDGRTGNAGELEVPTTFEVTLTPWYGQSAPVTLTARLRYRVSPTGLQIGYALTDVDRALDAAFDAILQPIREAGFAIIAGTP